MNTYTLHELTEFIRRVIALNLPQSLWVCSEIAQQNFSRGHCYLQLIEKTTSSDELLARGEAVIWSNTVKKLQRKLGKQFRELLQPGLEVKLLVKVNFNERYGFKLVVEDVDPVYTLGKLESVRRQTMAALQAQQLIGKNHSLPLPLVLQRIALISSDTAAGYEDFNHQLATNPYGFDFHCELFPAAMQGAQVRPEVKRQLRRIQQLGHFDCVVITRGGGSRLDLLAFDDFELCKAVANCRLPVIVGIGHEVDETILDHVAHTALKTPTAVAEFLINQNLHFDATLIQAGQTLLQLSQQRITTELLWLEEARQGVHWQAKAKTGNQQQQLSYLTEEIRQNAYALVRLSGNALDHLEQICQLLDVDATLSRGYSLVTKGNSLLVNSDQVAKGDRIKSHLHRGTIESEVVKSMPKEL